MSKTEQKIMMMPKIVFNPDYETPLYEMTWIAGEPNKTTKPETKKTNMKSQTPKVITLDYDPVFGAKLVETDAPETTAGTNNAFAQTQKFSRGRKAIFKRTRNK
ncbi:MAG: hypothetical protein FWE64_02830 [Alphaproteobacteria bacterium]|nr:hypothetical protein [Alphaproteobacteria bacterium]